MKLIEKDYYTLAEVVADWNMPRHDVMYLAETGRMRLSIRICQAHLEWGEWQQDATGEWCRLPLERAAYTGLVDIKDQDAHLIFRDGGTEVSAFHAPNGSYCDLVDNNTPVAAFETDLLVRADERRRLEQSNGKPEADRKLTLLTHDASYQHVTLGNRQFRFGKIQARIIRLLHQASTTDSPWCKGSKLVEQSQSRCYRLVDVFKSQPHWRELIESDGRGSYRLAIPPC